MDAKNNISVPKYLDLFEGVCVEGALIFHKAGALQPAHPWGSRAPWRPARRVEE